MGFCSAGLLAIIGWSLSRWVTMKDAAPKEAIIAQANLQAIVDRETTDVKTSLAATIFSLNVAIKEHAKDAKESFRELNATLHETREDVAVLRADSERTQRTIESIESSLTRHIGDNLAHTGIRSNR